MDNSAMLVFGRGNPAEFNYGSPFYYRRGMSDQIGIDLDEGKSS